MKLPKVGVRRFLPKKIWQQIFLILILLVIIPLVTLGSLLLNTFYKAMKDSSLRHHREIAVHATGEIYEHIKGSRANLFVVASMLGILHADSWSQETLMVELSLKNTAFQRISSINLKGEEIATSQLGTNLQNRSEDIAFQKAKLGHSYLSEVKISDNYIPYLTIAEPIKQMGEVVGVIIADLSVRGVWDIVDNIKIGRLGKAYLIDRQGRIIAHQDKKLVLKNVKLVNTGFMKNVLLSPIGTFKEIDENGDPWRTSYAVIEKLNWRLIITQPEEELFLCLKKMNEQFVLLIVCSVFATLLMSFVLARYMSRPVRDVIRGTERIARGDYSHSFKIRGRSEIDKLLFSFNRMVIKLRKAQENEKLSVVGKAATTIAHELKNSLQLIDTFVNELPQRYRDKKFIQDFSDTIPKELDSCNNSLKNMTTYSSNSRFLMHELNINEVIKDVILLIKLKARQLNISFENNLEENISLIKGNAEKVRQVLLNVMTNALEATLGGGHVIVSTRKLINAELGDFGFIEIEVLNSGVGIDKNNLGKIFDPFFTTKREGLGLGLSICQDIVKQHNGSIDVVSKKNKTTSFIIRFPVYKEIGRKRSVI